jgi:acetyltransferase-like isoleucine patch superfamily enzyme
MKYIGEEKKFDWTLISIGRLFLLLFVSILAYGLAIFPALLLLYYTMQFLRFNIIVNLLILSFLLIIVFLLLVTSVILSTALFINLFNLKYEEGEYGKSLHDKTAFKFALCFALYFPTYKLINIFDLPPVKSWYLSLVGCKIGKNVFLAGEEWITDPCVIEIGENTMIGGRTIVSGHLAEDKLRVKKVTIGKNCLIGGDSFIMPGAVIEDNVVVGARSLVTKNQHLKKGKTYVGIPAREVQRHKTPSSEKSTKNI